MGAIIVAPISTGWAVARVEPTRKPPRGFLWEGSIFLVG